MERREFLAGAGMMAASMVATKAAGSMAFASVKIGGPDIKIGVLSDSHQTEPKGRAWDVIVKTFQFFKDQNVDVVLHAGDLSNDGRVEELKATSEAWKKVFGSITAGPAKVFVTGNHEKVYYSQCKSRGELDNPRYTDGLYADPEKNWMELFGEKWEPIFIKQVKGYSFVGAHWGEWWNTKRFKAFLEAHKAELDPAKPFFYTQHAHPQRTCYGTWTWHQDEGGETDRILADYPNAVAFSGHTHYMITDERTIWQETFTSVGTGSLVQLSAPIGRENGGWCRGTTAENPRRMRAMYDGWDAEAMIVSVWGERMIFERYDMLHEEKMGDDWDVPVLHGKGGERPYSFASRKARAAAPEFPEGSELTVTDRYGYHLGKQKEDQVALSIPLAVGTDSLSRVFDYEVKAIFEENDIVRTMLTKRFYHPGAQYNVARMPPCFDAIMGLDELPRTPFTFVVTPFNSFGVAGKPLRVDYRHPEFRKPPEKRLSQQS